MRVVLKNDTQPADGGSMGNSTQAVSYLRVSGLGQVSGDGFTRQREAIAQRAEAEGFELVAEFVDEGVSGTKGLCERPGLSALLDRVLSNGVRIVLVEKADRLARDLIEGELILREFRKAGVRVVESESGTDLTDGDDNPTATLIRQVLGAVSEFEKSAIVSKLRGARARKRRETGRCEGPRPYGELEGEADILRQVRRLRRRNPKTGESRSAAAIAVELDRLRLPTRSGRPWSRHSVREILKRV